jgi:membrane protease YdiL (CAAX protease family)
MHLSGVVAPPIIMFFGVLFGRPEDTMAIGAVSFWLVFSFTLAFILILIVLRKEMKTPSLERDRATIGQSVSWAIGGVFLALFAQIVAANIERLIGIEVGSENTEQIISIIEAFPIVMLVSSIIGPILEEIVFRKIIFGSLYKKFNFVISGIISSVIFAFAHLEPEHVLLYTAMGFTFAFLYVKTKRILVPIFAHVAMNTFVVITQSVFKEEIEKMLREAEKIQSFIGGF